LSDRRIIVIEDDPQIRRFLRNVLHSAGYSLYEAETAARGVVEAAARRPDLVLLDLGLPDADGIETLRQLRSWNQVPVIVISARDQEHIKVQALDLGADDYLVKPFGTEELLARIRVALRHAARDARGEAEYASAGLTVDLEARRVVAHGRDIKLTPTEYALLAELVRNAGRVVTHRQLLRAVWGPAHATDTHYLRLYMAQLRAKLELDSSDPQLLLTEQGVGYRLAEPRRSADSD
jgi:two-component system, OmpR family, KDP operon response regulator KdpE